MPKRPFSCISCNLHETHTHTLTKARRYERTWGKSKKKQKQNKTNSYLKWFAPSVIGSGKKREGDGELYYGYGRRTQDESAYSASLGRCRHQHLIRPAHLCFHCYGIPFASAAAPQRHRTKIANHKKLRSHSSNQRLSVSLIQFPHPNRQRQKREEPLATWTEREWLI